MLRLIVFLCGAALMGLELVAARVLAPTLGNSIYVWGSVITSVMVALSIGYWLGGQPADRFDAARLLPLVIAGAAVGTVLAPLIAGFVLPWAADLGPRLGALVASALIFFLPSVLLAMVSPIGVRLAANKGMEHVGRSAGGLYSVSTAGSIAGTLLTAFWLIPLLSLEPLIIWTGFLLGGTSLLALLTARRYAPAGAAGTVAHDGARSDRPGAAGRSRPGVVVAAILGLVATSVFVGAAVLITGSPVSASNSLGETVLFRADTQYHRLTVTEDTEVRHLRFDSSHQSAVYLDDAYESAIKYPDYFHLALAANPDAKRVLVLGLGGGTVVKRMWRDYPEMTIDAVEIDPVVVDVSRRYFGMPEDERVEMFTEDARRFVQRADDKYDIVIVDAYYADGVPFHLTTAEFFDEIEQVLAPDGVVAYNVIASVEGDKSRLFRSLYRTAGGVWDNLWVFPIGLGDTDELEKRRNIVVLATDADMLQAELEERIETRLDGRVSIPGFQKFGEDLYTGVVRMADVPALTDEHAPTDALIQID